MLQGFQLRRDPLPDPELVVRLLGISSGRKKELENVRGGCLWTNIVEGVAELHNHQLFLVENQKDGHKAGESMR